MNLRFLLDDNLRGPLWNAILWHNKAGEFVIDAQTVGDLPELPRGTPDPKILEWCEEQGRILVSLDRASLSGHLAEHLEAGRHSPGIMILRGGFAFRDYFEHLAMICLFREAWEFRDRLDFFA